MMKATAGSKNSIGKNCPDEMSANVTKAAKRRPEPMLIRRCQSLFSSVDGRLRIQSHELTANTAHATMK